MSKFTEKDLVNEIMNTMNRDKQVLNLRFMIALQGGERELVEELIFEDKVEYSEGLKKFFKDHPTPGFLVVQQMFEQRELNKKLNQDLLVKNIPERKLKI